MMAAFLLCCDKECDTLDAQVECKPIFHNPDSVILFLSNDSILGVGNAYHNIYDSINYGTNFPAPPVFPSLPASMRHEICRVVFVEGDCLHIPYVKTGHLSLRPIWHLTHNDSATGLPVVTLMMFGAVPEFIEEVLGFGTLRHDLTPVKAMLGGGNDKVLIHLKFYRSQQNDRAITYVFERTEQMSPCH